MTKQTEQPAPNSSGSPKPPADKPAAETPSAEKKLKNVRYRQGVPELRKPPRDTESARRKIVLWGTVVTFGIVAVLIALAVLQIAVIEPQRAVASVGGQNITARQLQSQMKLSLASLSAQYSQLQNQIAGIQQQSQGDQSANFIVQLYQQQLQQLSSRINTDSVAQSSLDTLINDQLIRQEAAKRGITVSPEDVQKELEKDFGYFTVAPTPFPTYTPAPVTPGATPGPTVAPREQPTSVPEGEYKIRYDNTVKYFESVGQSEADFRKTYELRLLEQRLRESLGKDVPATAPHFKFDYLSFNDEANATAALARLNSGAIAFPALISETNAITQPLPIGNGASEDWLSRSALAQQFDESLATALDTAALNKPTGVLTSTGGGFWILLPLGRETRALDESELATERGKPFDAWLVAAQQDPNLVKRLEVASKFLPNDVRNAIAQFQQQ